MVIFCYFPWQCFQISTDLNYSDRGRMHGIIFGHVYKTGQGMVSYINSLRIAEGVVMITCILLPLLFRQSPTAKPEVHRAPEGEEPKTGQRNA
jgi:hypothetical protein